MQREDSGLLTRLAAAGGDPLAAFHPVIQRWFRAHFPAPSPPQAQGWPAIRSGQDTLIAAPTGSGKTLAAFLWSIDALLRQALEGRLADETQVVYISPLKALSNDVQKNLAQPLAEIGQELEQMGLPTPEIRVLVRTGDTTSSQRQAMARRPPHILVTTPESLYILLTTEKGRAMLRTVRTAIVDEIHAVAGSKRGSHLALSLERLEALAATRPLRIGLSATQKPVEEVARLLVGAGGLDTGGSPRCAVVDQGSRRTMDMALELPGSPLEAVCSLETWDEVYDRLTQLISQERTTLVFVNTRRLAERITFHLAKRVGEESIMAHHGSLSREQRLRAEQRLKMGELRALVATASLELGIDIGSIDLVCQIGSPRSISTLLQRAGRSGHTLTGTPRARLFPLTRDELVECAALLSLARKGELDRLLIPQQPLDILAQQMVACVAAEEWDEEALFQLCRRAYPYRSLSRGEYEQVWRLLAEGFSTRTGRGGAYLHYDGVNRRFRARRGARLAAVTSGGAIPDNADYDVILEPENTLVGTVNEDFAVESIPGNIFQLGSSSWRILKVEPGKLRVEDAHGQPPTIPFWLGEAPARTDEVSAGVSRLRREVGELLPDAQRAIRWLMQDAGIDLAAAEQIVAYLEAGKAALGAVPTQETLVLERFFDESGGMQLVIHAPFGSRVNRAWGLALRKRFCRTFNFELQAAATDDAIVLSLGMQHSFPLEEVFDYLHPNSAREVLVQALLAAPMFTTRWRWDAGRALAILRQVGGRRIPPQLQRMRAEDLMAAVFPEALACLENVVGDVEIPDHPLVNETLKDCLHEVMDVDRFLEVLRAIHQRRLTLVARDVTEPSPFAHEILTARPYAFLDDAPLEERRTQAVYLRRALPAAPAAEMGHLDMEAIQRVREQAWPEVESPDELHDALLVTGFLTDQEVAPWRGHLDALLEAGRATRLEGRPEHALWAAAERLPLLLALFPEAVARPRVQVPGRELEHAWTSEEALRELIRGRLEVLGPMTAGALVAPLGLGAANALPALAALEGQGFALRGHFTGDAALEWCDRRLLARIHRYTLDRLRQEIEPVAAADYLRFLFVWQHLAPEHRLDGITGLVGVLEQLEGSELPISAWDQLVLPARLLHYTPSWLEELCLSGELVWTRLNPSGDGGSRKAGATRHTPVALVFRENLPLYLGGGSSLAAQGAPLGGVARQVLECLEQRGACFSQEIVRWTRQLSSDVEDALRELAAWGLVTCDGFAGLLSLTSPVRRQVLRRGRQPATSRLGLRTPAGRWSLLEPPEAGQTDPDSRAEHLARQLLRRYGVVFHRLLQREASPPPWRDLVRVYRRLEARGEIRGGRFVAGFTGEQYALPEAVQQLRAVRRQKPDGSFMTINGADPLNLVGIVAPGARVPALTTNQIVFRDGVPYAVKTGRQISYLRPPEEVRGFAATP